MHTSVVGVGKVMEFLRDKPIREEYSQDRQYRYQVFGRPDGTYTIWVQRKITDAYMGDDWHTYADIQDHMHLADSVERAVEIGNEALRNLA